MNKLPEPSTIKDSMAFVHWCEEAGRYIEQFETQVMQRVALEQRNPVKPPLVYQTVINPEQFPGVIQDFRFYKMPAAGEIAHGHNVLFAALSESNIEKLCRETHTFHIEGQDPLSVRFKRSSLFFDAEEKLVRRLGQIDPIYARQLHFSTLSYPFLPYTRKFVTMVQENGQPVRAPFFLSQLALQPELVELREKLLGPGMCPVWNVLTDTKFVQQVEQPTPDRWIWQPQESDFRYDVPPIIHAVRKRNAPDFPAGSVAVVEGRRIESAYAFDEIEYSEIETIPENLPGTLTLYPVAGMSDADDRIQYWYRHFLQGFQLSRSDVAMLVHMLPATHGRFEVRELTVEPIKNTRENVFADDRFKNHLWYLQRNQWLSGFSAEQIRVVSVQCVRTAFGEDNCDFLDEDRIHFLASVIEQHLPAGFMCRGILL